MSTEAEAYNPLRDPRMKWRNDADPIGLSYNTQQCWFVCATEGRRNSPRESTEQLWNRVLLPLQPRPTRILELGQWEGASGLWTLHNLKPELWVGVDPWIPDRRHHAERYVEARSHFFNNFNAYLNCEPVATKNRWSGDPRKHMWHGGQEGSKNVYQIEISSQDYLRHGIDEDFPGQPFDMIYVDAAHSAIEAMSDMLLSWRKLAAGGLMIIDDFDRRYHNARPAVHEAALAWWSCVEWNATKVFENRRQFWIRKIKPN